MTKTFKPKEKMRKKLKTKKRDRFSVGITGLSEDMIDFILEQNDYYTHHQTKFWSSFWKTCADMWVNGVDLSDKQFTIINREYIRNMMKRLRKT